MRVLELGQLLAGPFAGSVLGYFGAEVIKIEPPGKGDLYVRGDASTTPGRRSGGTVWGVIRNPLP